MAFGFDLSAAADLDVDVSYSLNAGLDLLASLNRGGDKAPKSAQPAKAMIIPLDRDSGKGDKSKALVFQFNPGQIRFNKTTTWNSNSGAAANGGAGGAGNRTPEPKRNVPTSEFQGGNAQTLSMDLLFDTTDTGEDVRKYTDLLVSLTLIDTRIKTQPARPALVKFVWGEFSTERPVGKATRNITSFTAYVQNANINFTLFLQDGTPVRAETQVTFTAQTDNGVLPFQTPPRAPNPARWLWCALAKRWITSPISTMAMPRSGGILRRPITCSTPRICGQGWC